MPGFPVHHQFLEFTQLMSVESVMPSNHPVLCRPLLLLPSIIPSIRVFSNESVLVDSCRYTFYLFLLVLGLCCCVRAFSSRGKRGYFSLQCRGFSAWWLLLWATGSRHVNFSSWPHAGSVLAHGLSCSPACEIFQDQGLNSCSLRWQADSYTLYH